MSVAVPGQDYVELRDRGGVLLIGTARVLRDADITFGLHGGSRRGWAAASLLASLIASPDKFSRLRTQAQRLGWYGISEHLSNQDLISRISADVSCGQLVMLYLPDRLGQLFWIADRDTLSVPASKPVDAVPPAVGAVSTWSVAQRVGEALKRTPDYLGGELRASFQALVSPASLAFIVGAFVALAVAQAYGVGEIVDAGLAAFAYFTAGLAGLSAVYDLVVTTVHVSRAQSQDAIDEAAKRYAHDVAVLGISAITALVARFKRGSKGGDEGPPAEPQQASPKPPPRRTGGRLGSAATRAQNAAIADDLESQGYVITGGGGRLPEEYIPGSGPGTAGSTYVDITAQNPDTGEILRVQTIDTLADGSPTAREAAAAARIQTAFPNDVLQLVPKQ